MSVEREAAAAEGLAVRRRTVELAVGASAFALGLVVMWDTHRLGAGWEGGSPESGYFPFRLGAIIAIAAAVIFLRALLARESEPAIFVTWARLRLVLAVLIPMLAYIGVIHLLGIYAASALFIGAFMRFGGGYGWVKSAIVGAATGAVLFWLFEVQFLVPLPKGPLEALFGY
ncbi:MAG TPA: tripartite tricarboxylate transporter TctB family protein [Usitatibacter sp.]|nr:tripartite tricarboxylate transporter TctB family protein [Usitatibacter sp.]